MSSTTHLNKAIPPEPYLVGPARRGDLDTARTLEVAMPYPQSIPIHPRRDTTDAHIRPHYDGCPECLVRWNAPTRTWPQDGGCRSTYRCHSCRHTWWTSWHCEEGLGG